MVGTASTLKSASRFRRGNLASLMARRRVELGLAQREVSIPQTHLAGAEGEVDFGEFYATIAGVWMCCPLQGLSAFRPVFNPNCMVYPRPRELPFAERPRGASERTEELGSMAGAGVS